MKRFFVVALAAFGLVACVQENVTELPSGGAISFENAFIDNATRAAVDPSTTTASLGGFDVWGYVKSTNGVVFDNVDVTKNGGEWSYTGTQYWAPEQPYFFAALAPMNSTNVSDLTLATGAVAELKGLGKFTFTNVDGSEDLLYATAHVTAKGAGEDNDPVAFTFKHLLSKVKFTFSNGFPTENMNVVVTNVKMTAPAKATIDVNVDDYAKGWELGTEEAVTLAFGNVEQLAMGAAAEATDERLTIPAAAEYTYTIDFDVEVLVGTESVYTLHKTSTVTGVELEMGKAYNFAAELNATNLNLDDIEFAVTEVEDWEQTGDTDYIPGEGAYYVSNRDEFQAALNAVSGIQTRSADVPSYIYFTKDITGNVIIDQVEGKSYVIDGRGYKYDGMMDIYGHARSTGEETLTIKNVAFEHAGSDLDFITCNTTESEKRYAHNVTIENCTFTGDYANGSEVMGMRFRQCYDIVVKDCEATDMYGLLWGTGGNNYTVDGVTMTDSKNGISFGTTNNVSVLNSNIEVEAYGVRADGSVTTTLTLADNTIKANQPVIVRKLTGNYNVEFTGDNNLTTTGDYQVILTKDSDDEAYVAPTGEYTITGAEDVVYYPAYYSTTIDTPEAFAAAVKSTNEHIAITLGADIDVAITDLGQQTGGSGEYKLGGENTKSITIDLNGKTLNITTTYWSALGAKNADALFTIKNGTMTSTGNSAGTWNAWDLRFSNCNYVFEDVDFLKAVALDNAGKSVDMKNVTITDEHNTDTYGLWITAEGQTVTLDGCTINMEPASDGRGIKIDEQYVDAPAKVTLTVKNTKFITEEKSAILVKSVAGAEINVENIDITNVAADTEFAVWVDEDAKAYADLVVVNGAYKKVEGADLALADTADALVEALENGEDVVLAGDITVANANAGSNAYGKTGINVLNGQTIDGNGNEFGVDAWNTWDSAINTTGGLIKNIIINKGFRGIFVNHNGTYSEKVVLENVTIDGTIYTISCDQGRNQGLEATDCTFNGWTSYAATLGEAKFKDCYFGEGQGYAYCRPYAPTEFVGCEFEAGFEMDPRAAVTFENCTLNGVELTADNLATLVTSNIANATVK